LNLAKDDLMFCNWKSLQNFIKSRWITL